MAFQFRAQLKDRQSVERSASEFVQTVQNAEPNGGAATQTARARNVFYDRTRKCKAPALGSLKEKIGSLCDDRRERFTFCRARDSYRIVDAKRDTQAIEARPEIGSAGWDADRDALCHWQFEVGAIDLNRPRAVR